jgi:hypothetical protein
MKSRSFSSVSKKGNILPKMLRIGQWNIYFSSAIILIFIAGVSVAWFQKDTHWQVTLQIQSVFADREEDEEDEEEDHEENEEDYAAGEKVVTPVSSVPWLPVVPSAPVQPSSNIPSIPSSTSACTTTYTTVYDTVTSASGTSSQVPRQVSNVVCSQNTPVVPNQAPTPAPLNSQSAPTPVDTVVTVPSPVTPVSSNSQAVVSNPPSIPVVSNRTIPVASQVSQEDAHCTVTYDTITTATGKMIQEPIRSCDTGSESPKITPPVSDTPLQTSFVRRDISSSQPVKNVQNSPIPAKEREAIVYVKKDIQEAFVSEKPSIPSVVSVSESPQSVVTSESVVTTLLDVSTSPLIEASSLQGSGTLVPWNTIAIRTPNVRKRAYTAEMTENTTLLASSFSWTSQEIFALPAGEVRLTPIQSLHSEAGISQIPENEELGVFQTYEVTASFFPKETLLTVRYHPIQGQYILSGSIQWKPLTEAFHFKQDMIAYLVKRSGDTDSFFTKITAFFALLFPNTSQEDIWVSRTFEKVQSTYALAYQEIKLRKIQFEKEVLVSALEIASSKTLPEQISQSATPEVPSTPSAPSVTPLPVSPPSPKKVVQTSSKEEKPKVTPPVVSPPVVSPPPVKKAKPVAEPIDTITSAS